MPCRCVKCILPSNLPSVYLDKTGKCNYCSSFEKKFLPVPGTSSKSLEAEFEKILARYRGKNQYDCLVPVSGGKDSMYVLYLLSTKYKLNILAYNFDNGFQSPQAVNNINKAIKKLGVDLVIYRPKEKFMLELYRIFLTRTGEFCSPCNTIIASMAKIFAKQNNIKLIMSGNSDKYSSAISGVSASQYCDRKYFFNVLKGYKTSQNFMRYIFHHPIQHAIWKLTGTGPETVNVMNYFHPGIEKLQKTLETELNWESPSGEYEHGDCLLNPLKDYLMCRKWGCSELTQAYSNLIRTGEISRENALKKAEQKEVRETPAILESFLNKIDMSYDDFEKSINRHFTDFQNHDSSILYKAGKKCLNIIHKPM